MKSILKQTALAAVVVGFGLVGPAKADLVFTLGIGNSDISAYPGRIRSGGPPSGRCHPRHANFHHFQQRRFSILHG